MSSRRGEPQGLLCCALEPPPAVRHSPEDEPEEYLDEKTNKNHENLTAFVTRRASGRPSAASTCKRRGFAQRAVLVVDVRRAVAGAERRGGGEHQLLLDEADFGMVLRQLLQPLLQSTPEQVQTLGGAAQTTLSLRERVRGHGERKRQRL